MTRLRCFDIVVCVAALASTSTSVMATPSRHHSRPAYVSLEANRAAPTAVPAPGIGNPNADSAMRWQDSLHGEMN